MIRKSSYRFSPHPSLEQTGLSINSELPVSCATYSTTEENAGQSARKISAASGLPHQSDGPLTLGPHIAKARERRSYVPSLLTKAMDSVQVSSQTVPVRKDSDLSHSAATSGQRVLRLAEVVHLTGYRRASIYAKGCRRSVQFDPTFPQRVSLSPSGRGAVGWLEAELLAWLQLRADARAPVFVSSQKATRANSHGSSFA